MVLGGEAFGRRLGGVGGALLRGIRVLKEEASESTPTPIGEGPARRRGLWTRQGLTQH